ncbi:MAG TPA: DUF5668 domain-containing protein [Bacteroidota bacterium]|nr:DUF5668 domain-containing protein [Bacteroidota bacterium]
METIARRPWLGIGLIAVGVVLLLHQLRVIPIDWRDVWWAAVCIVGVWLIVRGFTNKGKGMFWGVVAAGVGGYKLLMWHTSVYIPNYLAIPSLMILAGVGILFVYFTQLDRWHLLVPSLLLIGLGGLIVVAEEGYIDRWTVIDFLRTWWPASLVLFGTAMLLNHFWRRGEH